jgi:hypothetical protein
MMAYVGGKSREDGVSPNLILTALEHPRPKAPFSFFGIVSM